VDYDRGMATRVVRIDRSPPRRLLAHHRWRTFKVGPDRQVWEQAMAPVWRAIDEGYDIARVFVQWGQSRPFGVERETRLLTGCVDECELLDTYGEPGRGYTEFTLEDGS
jgi:hypothetical protein